MEVGDSLEITIHRGTHQIGGCVTEIATSKTRIFIDLGDELPSDETSISEFEIGGVTTGERNCDAIFFTHYHGDHVGMISKVLPEIPMYIGESAKQIFEIYLKKVDSVNKKLVDRLSTYLPGSSVTVGDIKVTPFLVDHSAYDAYMLLIEAEGKRVLHTGDFRTHGFRGTKLLPMLEKHVGQVDILITEGTQISRSDYTTQTERQLQDQAKKMMKDKKYIFILCPSTNIDRIAAFYQAFFKVYPRGRYFICDQYQKEILDLVTKNGGTKTSLYRFDKVKVIGANLYEKMHERGFCMLVRANGNFKKILDLYKKEDILVIYSMWSGYLENERIANFLEGHEFEFLHTSGHATKEAIEAVIRTVQPKVGIIPIHCDKPKLILDLDIQSPLLFLEDGQKINL